MFDIGLAELVVVAVVALLVVGPERMPETVRTLALWLGRLRRAAARAVRELEREVGVDEIRQQLHNEEVLRRLGEDPGRAAVRRAPPHAEGQPEGGERPAEGERR